MPRIALPPRPCDSFNCAGVFLPVLLATFASSLLLGCVLMGATYTYQSAKRRTRGGSGTRFAVVALAGLQVAVESANASKIFNLFATNYGDVDSISRHRLVDTLAPFLGVVIEACTLLLLIGRAYEAMRLRRWGSWKRRSVLAVLGAGWTAGAVGGCGFALQVKVLTTSTLLSPHQAGGDLLDSFALLWLVAASCVTSSAAGLLLLERFRRPRSPRYGYMKPPYLNKALATVSAALAIGSVVAVVQAVALIAWLLQLQHAQGSQTTWLHGLLTFLPSIYTCTAISVLANPLPRPRPVRRSSKHLKEPLSAFDSHSNYYGRPFLMYTTASTADSSASVSFGSFPTVPPYSARVRLPVKREGGFSQSFSRFPRDVSGGDSGGGRGFDVPSALQSYGDSVSSLSHHPFHRSSHLAVCAEPTASQQEQTLLPTIIIDVGLDEEDTLVHPISEMGPDLDEEKGLRTPQDRVDAVSLAFREVGRLETAEGGSGRKKRAQRRMGIVQPREEEVEEAEKELGELYEKLSLSSTSLFNHRRPSNATSASAYSSDDPTLPSQRCSTPSLKQYDPVFDAPDTPVPSLRLGSTSGTRVEPVEQIAPTSLDFLPSSPTTAAPAPASAPHPPVPAAPTRRTGNRHARWSSVLSGTTQASGSSFGCRDGQ
ncbi:hypothetical protein JCM6882_000568 [Rhodosporidiobolus microsporus]